MKLFLAAALVLVQQFHHSATVQPGQTQQPCVSLAVGERLEVSFSADTAMDFNIHYEDDTGVHFPVNETAVAQWTGVYIAPHKREYCLMWTNNHSSAAADLSYSYDLYRVE